MHHLVKKTFFLSACGLFSAQLSAQTTNIPYSPTVYQSIDSILYSPKTRFHTSIRPEVFRDTLNQVWEAATSRNPVSSSNWFMRKIFNEHLIEVNKEDFRFYADFLPDLMIGKDFGNQKRNVWQNSRGLQAGLSIKDKFTLYTNFFESQQVFPEYMENYISKTKIVPGQGGGVKFMSKNEIDWMYSTANITYHVNSYLDVSLGYDKNFIGDGYRSLLLSDFSSNMANLRLTGTVGNVRYASIWGYMNDPTRARTADIDSTYNENARFGDQKKWGAFQYLDWNVTNRLSVGFFQSVVWANRDEADKRGFDFSYAMPVVFIRPIESNVMTSPDKMFLGLNAKYKTFENLTFYGQFLLGEFTAKHFFSNDGYTHNKWGVQVGAKAFNIFGITNLSGLAEFNAVRPFTYAHFKYYSNYSNNGEPLAHPLGANFRELVGILNYRYNRWNFNLHGTYYKKGLDLEDGSNVGGDIFRSYMTAYKDFGNSIGQGISSKQYYLNATTAYVLNPKYNLRFEVGYTGRYNRIDNATPVSYKTNMLNIGLRSSFRVFSSDF